MKTVLLPAHAQRGSTLVGFVVGMLVGLALALSVAVYVTRVPVPLVDRGVSRSSAQDAQEAQRNKGWNPNAQIAGPQAPLPAEAAAKAAAAAAASADMQGVISVPPTNGQALPTPPPAASGTAAVPGTAKPAADPLGDLVNAKLGQAAAASAVAPGTDPFIYFVQAGAFKTSEDAEAQHAKLAMMGMSAAVSEREQSGRTVFRVRLGPFNDKAMAEATREQLEVQGVQAALVRVQR